MAEAVGGSDVASTHQTKAPGPPPGPGAMRRELTRLPRPRGCTSGWWCPGGREESAPGSPETPSPPLPGPWASPPGSSPTQLGGRGRPLPGPGSRQPAGGEGGQHWRAQGMASGADRGQGLCVKE